MTTPTQTRGQWSPLTSQWSPLGASEADSKQAGLIKASLGKPWHRRFLNASSPQEIIFVLFTPLLDSQPSHQGQLETQLSSVSGKETAISYEVTGHCWWAGKWRSKNRARSSFEVGCECLWAASNYGHESGMTWRRSGALGSLTSIWFIDFSPGTLQLGRNYLILWLTRLLLIAASLIWRSTSTTTMEGFGGRTPLLINRCMHVTKAGGCSIRAGNLSWKPENKPEVKPALNWQESLILYVCHRAEQPAHQSLRNKQYFMYY